MSAQRLTKGAAVTGVGASPAFAGVIGESEKRVFDAGEEVEASRARARVLGIAGDSGDCGDSSSTKTESLEKEPAELSPPVIDGPVTGGDTPSAPTPTDPSLDALELPVAWWAHLPVPSSLLVATSSGVLAWFTASRSRASTARAAREAVFGPSEYEALVLAIAEQRATRNDVERWVRRKLEVPTWLLEPLAALGDALSLVVQVGDPKVARVFRARPELLGSTTWARALELAGLRCVRVVVEQPAAAVDEAAAAAALEAM